MTNAVFRPLRPVLQCLEFERVFRTAPLGIERDLPRPASVPTCFSSGKFLPEACPPLRNTTKNISPGSNRSGTVVRPPCWRNSGRARRRPLSGSQASGRSPVTRNRHCADTAVAARLPTKIDLHAAVAAVCVAQVAVRLEVRWDVHSCQHLRRRFVRRIEVGERWGHGRGLLPPGVGAAAGEAVAGVSRMTRSPPQISAASACTSASHCG